MIAMKPLFRINSIGMKFGKLKIVGISEKEGFVKCICDCGKECEKFLTNMKRKMCKSCGCLSGEAHGLWNHPEWKTSYKSWQHMKMRCNNPNEVHFKNYGGRGIKVCDRWQKSFVNFLTDMGQRPEGYSLDRIDVNGMYCPENCKWSTKLEQDNNRRTNIMVIVKNVKMSFKQACRSFNLPYWKVYHQVRKGSKTHQEAIDSFIGYS